MMHKLFKPLKHPQNATQAALRVIVGGRRNVAVGVSTVLGSDPHVGDPTEGRAAS